MYKNKKGRHTMKQYSEPSRKILIPAGGDYVGQKLQFYAQFLLFVRLGTYIDRNLRLHQHRNTLQGYALVDREASA